MEWEILGEDTYKPNSQWPEPVRAFPSAPPEPPANSLHKESYTSLRRLHTGNRKSSQISTAIPQPL